MGGRCGPESTITAPHCPSTIHTLPPPPPVHTSARARVLSAGRAASVLLMSTLEHISRSRVRSAMPRSAKRGIRKDYWVPEVWGNKAAQIPIYPPPHTRVRGHKRGCHNCLATRPTSTGGARASKPPRCTPPVKLLEQPRPPGVWSQSIKYKMVNHFYPPPPPPGQQPVGPLRYSVLRHMAAPHAVHTNAAVRAWERH